MSEVTPTGAVVHGACSVRTPGVCQVPQGLGAVFAFLTAGGQVLACRACASVKYSRGEWAPPAGYEVTKPFLDLTEYVLRAGGGDDITRVNVASEYRHQSWRMQVPVIQGSPLRTYWIGDLVLRGAGHVRVAFPDGRPSLPGMFTLTPPSLADYQATKALLVARR